MYKRDLALNNMQRLICHKTQPKKYYSFSYFFRDVFCIQEYANFEILKINCCQ